MPHLLPDMTQVALVSDDVEATTRRVRDLLGLGAFQLRDFREEGLFETTLDGRPEPWRMFLSISWIGDKTIEVIEPAGGDSVFRRFLRRGLRGVQHTAIDRGGWSYEEMKAGWAAAGAPIAQEGKTNVTTIGYTDTFDTLKLSIETLDFAPGMTAQERAKTAKVHSWIGDPATLHELPADSLVTGVTKFYLIVDDVDATTGHYAKLTDAPIRAFETPFTNLNTCVACKAKLAFLDLKTTQVVFVQPLAGDDLFARLREARGEGAHIVGMTARAADEKTLVGQFAGKGWQHAMKVRVGKQTLHYFHRDDSPFDVEVAL